jgi:hypothetical protein
MHELAFSEFHKVLPLIEPFDYSLSIQAAVVGNNPGRICRPTVRLDNIDSLANFSKY